MPSGLHLNSEYSLVLGMEETMVLNPGPCENATQGS